MRDVLPLQAAIFPLALFSLGYRTRRRSGLSHEAKAPYARLALLGGLLAICTWRSDSLQASPDLLWPRSRPRVDVLLTHP